jgi:hypothetical protein
MGLACRRVNGQLRFLSVEYVSGLWPNSPGAILVEFGLPEDLAQPIRRLTGQWNDIWQPLSMGPNMGGGDEFGLWWDDENKRLFTCQCRDYPGDGSGQDRASYIGSICTRTLGASNGPNSPGKISDLHGQYGVEGVGQRAIYGSVTRIPDWWRTANGVTQKYLVGWGGYASRMNVGLVPSMGLFAVAIPEPGAYQDGTPATIPAKDCIIMADHRLGNGVPDWFDSKAPTTRDRGVRGPNVVNYFDGGDTRQNPSTEPTAPPAATGYWQSPDPGKISPRPCPDGRGRFVWGDSYYGTGCWVDGAKKHGILVVATLARGRTWYQSSSLYCDGREIELHCFDPADLAAVARGKLAPWAVQPRWIKTLTPDFAAQDYAGGTVGNNPGGGVAGACFDAKESRLYLWARQPTRGGKMTYGNDLFVYQVKE